MRLTTLSLSFGSTIHSFLIYLDFSNLKDHRCCGKIKRMRRSLVRITHGVYPERLVEGFEMTNCFAHHSDRKARNLSRLRAAESLPKDSFVLKKSERGTEDRA